MGSGLALVELGQIPKVIYVSPSFCRNIGADPQTYPLPQPLAELIHPDDLLSLTQTLQEAGRSGQMVEHTHRVRAQGEEGWLWWHIRGMRIEYQNPKPVVLVTTMDISQFKSSQQALEEVSQRFQAAFGQTYNLLWEVDLSAHTFSVFAADGETRLEEFERKYLRTSGPGAPNDQDKEEHK